MTSRTLSRKVRSLAACAAVAGALPGCNASPLPEASRSRAGIARAAAAPTDSAPVCTSGSGAHLSHLQNTPIRNALTCVDCHLCPDSSPQFGTLATSHGATPSYDLPSATCSGVYCHGATIAAGVNTTAGAAPLVPTNTTPIWTITDGTQAYCGACHGLPPATGQHPFHAYLGRDCYVCHDGLYSTRLDLGPPSVNPALHVNANVEVSLINWDPTLVKPGTDTERGTSAGCHGGTRYWFVTSGSCR